MLCVAIACRREQVARGLLNMGVDIDELREYWDSGEVLLATDAGIAIRDDDVAALSFCHRLGASLSAVARFEAGNHGHDAMLGEHCSAFQLAIARLRPACLEYLLDKVYPARPIDSALTSDTAALRVMATLAARNTSAMPILRILETRGFPFRLLEETIFVDLTTWNARAVTPAGSSNQRLPSIADLMLATARECGDAHMLRYLEKDLGLGTKTD